MPTQKSALIICNGEIPSQKLLQEVLRTKPFIICADGGANVARKFNIKPNIIIGDFDSITAKTKKHFSSVEQIHITDQYSTDLEKSLNYAVKNKIKKVIILGGTGKRIDHTFSNLSVVAKYQKKIHITLKDNLHDIFLINKKIFLNYKIGTTLSLLPFGKCEGIITKGLQYPLKNETLEFGVREGTSNVIISSPISISVKKGKMFIFALKKIERRVS